MSVADRESKRPTLVLALKARDGMPAETVRLPGVELRYEPERSRLVVHRNGRDLVNLDIDEVERWSVEPE